MALSVQARSSALVPDPHRVVRKHILVAGVVQGVGFRPWIYNLATSLSLVGFVINTSDGAAIEVEGAEVRLQEFLSLLPVTAPPLAQIEDIQIREIEPLGVKAFCIQKSVPEPGKFALVSTDVATCFDCLREFTDPQDRRFGYPFINCTNCGPRYTIIRDIPYDRPLTTMASFQMCAECQTEYDDPENRRFHAQPNACAVCGPSVKLVATSEFADSGVIDFDREEGNLEAFRRVREVLRAGSIVAFKGLGGFQLVCDALNDASVRLLRERKRRSDKAFALMARDMAHVEQFAAVSPAERDLLLSPERPIVIVCWKRDGDISDAVAPGNPTVGVMLPYTPLHELLFGELPQSPPEFMALVVTSGNLSEEPIARTNQEAWEQLRPLADYFLLHNRDIHTRVDDSVARVFEGSGRIMRRSRGYAPQSINLGNAVEEILACGAELKHTFCVTKGHYAILSQHIGDLSNYETQVFLEETLGNLKKLFRVEPKFVACDLHPLYMSTKFAKEQGLPTLAVQHHHAHIASCMAENRINGKVIGVALDGTGYGTDGNIWGGEFMVADFAGFERRAHFAYVPLAGADTAVRQPWRSAISYLASAYESEASNLDLPLFHEIKPHSLSVVNRMLERNINTVLTSSCGRLFDAVASIVGLRHETNFEGQAAIELEAIADDYDGSYEFEIESGDIAKIDFRPMIRGVVNDLRGGKQAPEISAKFHATLASVIDHVCRRIRTSDGFGRVCLSGGTFQNMRLLSRAATKLRKSGFEVYLHAKVPPSDGGISLGQALIANAAIKNGAMPCA